MASISKRCLLTLVSLFLVQSSASASSDKKDFWKECYKFSANPSLDIDKIVNKIWRIHYLWPSQNVAAPKDDVELYFKKATSEDSDRVYNDMHKYLSVQPPWNKPAMLVYVTANDVTHESLFFTSKGAIGNFIGIPNMKREKSVRPDPDSVPVLNFFLKLVDGDRHMLMMLCEDSIALLSQGPTSREEITRVVDSLPLGLGEYVNI